MSTLSPRKRPAKTIHNIHVPILAPPSLTTATTNGGEMMVANNEGKKRRRRSSSSSNPMVGLFQALMVVVVCGLISVVFMGFSAQLPLEPTTILTTTTTTTTTSRRATELVQQGDLHGRVQHDRRQPQQSLPTEPQSHIRKTATATLMSPCNRTKINDDDDDPCHDGNENEQRLCRAVDEFVFNQGQKQILDDPKHEWSSHLSAMRQILECMYGTQNSSKNDNHNPITIVEVGTMAGSFGAQAQYLLTSSSSSLKESSLTIAVYHVVDPFIAGKGMLRALKQSIPKATADQISQSWATSFGTRINKAIKTTTTTLKHENNDDECHQTSSTSPLQVHRIPLSSYVTTSATLFQNATIDVVYLAMGSGGGGGGGGGRTHTSKPSYSDTVNAIREWTNILRPSGGILIVKDFTSSKVVARAVLEEATQRGWALRSIDEANVAIIVGPVANAKAAECTWPTSEDLLKHVESTQREAVVRENFELAANSGLPLSTGCSRRREQIVEMCSELDKNKETCMNHEVEIPIPPNKSSSDSDPNNNSNCKTLWFAGFHEGSMACGEGSSRGYSMDYSAALSSMLDNAWDALQPVLLLGRFGLETENSTELSSIGKWAEERGAKIIPVPRLSFQDSISVSKALTQLAMGVFMRMDIPRTIEEYSLFEDVNICQQYALFTDADVIFSNNITRHDVDLLKNALKTSGAILSYGREYRMEPHIQNTGVMVMDVPGFRKEWPSILEHGLSKNLSPLRNQPWLNSYFESSAENKNKRVQLPLYWNWKAYWRLEPSTFDMIKILHFHGPKPGNILEEIAKCDFSAHSRITTSHLVEYEPHFLHGICCDVGKTANWAIQSYEKYKSPKSELCS